MPINHQEETTLTEALRRRGDYIVRVDTLSCAVDEYRRDARRIGREQGWKMLTQVLERDDGDLVAVVWEDRPTTALEEEATRRVLNDAFGGLAPQDRKTRDEHLEDVRRENLRAVPSAGEDAR